ncbi:MAG: PDZ domain-containing protein [Planctomycetota bacterium]
MAVRGLVIALSWLALIGAASPAATAQRDEDVAALREAMAEMAVDSWPARAAAAQRLADLVRELEPGHALATLERAYTEALESDVDPAGHAEATRRFEDLAARVFVLSPKAGLGVSFSTNSGEGLRLGNVIPGFDAYTKLRENDVITAIAGVPIHGRDDGVTVAIVSHMPGESAQIDLKRDGEPMRVAVTFGDRARLQTPRQLSDAQLLRAWALRLERLRGDHGGGSLGWMDARASVRAPNAREPMRRRVHAPGVALGGEPASASTRRPGVTIVGEGDGGVERQLRAELLRLDRNLATTQAGLTRARSQRTTLQAEMRALPDTDAGRARRALITEQVAELDELLRSLQQEARTLNRERARILRRLNE